MDNWYVENAERIGQSTANMIASNCLPLIPEEVQKIAEKYQAKVVIIPIDHKLSNPKVRATYNRITKVIMVEERSLEALKLACERLGLGPVSRTDILAIHIAHELFHHLEEIGIVSFKMYYNCEKQRKGKYKISKLYSRPPLTSLREVAAHSFVKTILGLSISPECIEKMI